MCRLLTVFFLVLGLSACQIVPTTAQDYDPSRDFSHYIRYQWNEPKLIYQPDDLRIKSDLTEMRVVQAVGAALANKGMRPAKDKQNADFKIQAYLIVENKQYEEIDSGVWGGYWGPYWGGGPSSVQRRTINYVESTLQLDFVDAKDGKLVWRGSTTQIYNTEISTPEKKAAEIQKAVMKVLQKYPPQ